MQALFRYFASRGILANLITLSILGMGALTLYSINRTEFPTVDIGEIFITTVYPGASAEDVELNVTNKIERELKPIVGIRKYISRSQENLSFVHIFIDDDARDPDEIKTEIREALARISDFPSNLTEKPRIEEIKTSTFPVIEVGLSSSELDYSQLRAYAKIFERKLENLEGVARIDRYGFRDREVHINVNPRQLRRWHVSLDEVMNAIGKHNVRVSGGTLESFVDQRHVVTLSQFRTPEDVGNVIVRSTTSGQRIRVRDLASIEDGFERERIYSRLNGQKAISFVVIKNENADIIQTVDRIKNLVRQEQASQKDRIDFSFATNTAEKIRNQFQIVQSNGMIGLLLVLAVLAIFLNLRTAFWVALGIPVTVLGVICLLPAFDLGLDTVSLTAMIIVIGIVVDDAIIIAESIYHQKERGLPPVEAAVQGLALVIRPVLTTVFTTILAFLPMFFMKGILGKFTFVIPLVICLALTLSLTEAVFALPAHLIPGLRTDSRPKDARQPWFASFKAYYARWLQAVLRFRYMAIAAFTSCFIGAILYAQQEMDFILFPNNGANEFLIAVEFPVGTSLEATNAKIREIEDIVNTLPKEDLESYAVRVGAWVEVVTTEKENFATFMVTLTPYASRKRDAAEIVANLREQTDKITGVNAINYVIRSGGPPMGKPVLVRVVGPDDERRLQLARVVADHLQTLPGVSDVEVDFKTGKKELKINFDQEALAERALTVSDVAQHIRFAYEGQVVTSVRYGDEDVSFRVQVDKRFRRKLSDLMQLQIPNQERHLISLNQVARIDATEGPADFLHFEGQRAITITAEVDQSQTTPLKVSDNIQRQFADLSAFPGLRIVIGGEAKESSDALVDLYGTMAMAMIGIYLLLVLLFNSFLQPILVLFAIPFGIIGVIVTFALHDLPISFLAMIGMIGMVGVVVNDSLVLIDHLNLLRLRNDKRNHLELVAQGTADRFRAILLTTLSTVVGLLPLAYGIGGNDVYMAPMAMALGYGLFLATPLTLVLLPCLYAIGMDLELGLKKVLGHAPEPTPEPAPEAAAAPKWQEPAILLEAEPVAPEVDELGRPKRA